jgi:hypothetical protein
MEGTRAALEEGVAVDMAPDPRFEAEASLDEVLGKILSEELGAAVPANTRGIPPVLPYLLSQYDPQSPQELLLRALELRHTDMMGEFRSWKDQWVRAYQETSTVPREVERDIASVADAIKSALAPASRGFTFYFKVVPVPTAWRDRLWNWALSSIPGRNHVKMLYRLQLADRSMSFASRDEALTKQLHRIWKNASNE